MHIDTYIQSLDRQLNSSLQVNNANATMFAWFLALQTTQLERYHAKNEEVIEHDLPYASINLPSAPQVSLYVEPQHFTQRHRQKENLHRCSQPTLLVKFYNCLQPHSLVGNAQAQSIPHEVIENCPWYCQQEHRQTAQTQLDDFQGSPQQTINYDGISVARHSSEPLPSNAFVDNILANMEAAANHRI